MKDRRLPHAECTGKNAFTIIELLVAITVLVLLMVMIFSLLSRATDIWGQNTAKVGAFQEARKAFEQIGRNLSQATLNPYWDYQTNSSGTPTNYVRQSELHFLSGPATTLIGASTPPRPTDAVFFQAPLGYATNAPEVSDALNACGYFIEFGNDLSDRPPFLAGSGTPIPPRWRYRLMEMKQPTEDLNLYGLTSGQPDWPTSGVGNDWFAPALQSANPPTRLLAENIIALIITPKLDPRVDPSGTLLAPNYLFNSRKSVSYHNSNISGTTRNQMPPLMDLTLVAIDERSALRLAERNGTNAPDLGLASLFQDASKKDADLATLGKTLTDQHLKYRIFTTTVSVDSAKWSDD